jgi:outer membrane lipoprotein-sorting protein
LRADPPIGLDQHIKFGLIFLALVLCGGCSRNAARENNTNTSAALRANPAPTPPFSTKEPATYLAHMVITTELPPGIAAAAGSGSTSREALVAKDGNRRRSDLGPTGTIPSAYSLNLPEGDFVVMPSKGLYAKIKTTGEPVDVASELGLSPQRLMSEDTTSLTYELIGKEQVDGRNLTRYKVTARSAENGAAAESTVWVDEALGMPVKVETISGLSAENRSRFTVELRDISLNVDPALFHIPVGYKEVEFSVLSNQIFSVPAKSK